MQTEEEQSGILHKIQYDFLKVLTETELHRKNQIISASKAKEKSIFLIKRFEEKINECLKKGIDINAIDKNAEDQNGMSIFSWLDKIENEQMEGKPELFNYIKIAKEIVLKNGGVSRYAYMNNITSEKIHSHTCSEDQNFSETEKLAVKYLGSMIEQAEMGEL